MGSLIAFVRKYAKGIVAGIGYAATITTALGWSHYHWVSVILGVLSTIAVVLTKNSTPKPAGGRPAVPGGGGK